MIPPTCRDVKQRPSVTVYYSVSGVYYGLLLGYCSYLYCILRSFTVYWITVYYGLLGSRKGAPWHKATRAPLT